VCSGEVGSQPQVVADSDDTLIKSGCKLKWIIVLHMCWWDGLMDYVLLHTCVDNGSSGILDGLLRVCESVKCAK